MKDDMFGKAYYTGNQVKETVTGNLVAGNCICLIGLATDRQIQEIFYGLCYRISDKYDYPIKPKIPIYDYRFSE